MCIRKFLFFLSFLLKHNHPSTVIYLFNLLFFIAAINIAFEARFICVQKQSGSCMERLLNMLGTSPGPELGNLRIIKGLQRDATEQTATKWQNCHKDIVNVQKEMPDDHENKHKDQTAIKQLHRLKMITWSTEDSLKEEHMVSGMILLDGAKFAVYSLYANLLQKLCYTSILCVFFCFASIFHS